MGARVEAVLLWAVLVVVAVVDARERVIPNALVTTLVCIRAVRVALAVPKGGAAALAVESLAGFGAVATVLVLLFVVATIMGFADGLGGGDVKLFCALGLCLGARRALATILLACVAGVTCSRIAGRKRSDGGTFAFGPPVLIAYTAVVLLSLA